MEVSPATKQNIICRSLPTVSRSGELGTSMGGSTKPTATPSCKKKREGRVVRQYAICSKRNLFPVPPLSLNPRLFLLRFRTFTQQHALPSPPDTMDVCYDYSRCNCETDLWWAWPGQMHTPASPMPVSPLTALLSCFSVFVFVKVCGAVPGQKIDVCTPGSTETAPLFSAQKLSYAIFSCFP